MLDSRFESCSQGLLVFCADQFRAVGAFIEAHGDQCGNAFFRHGYAEDGIGVGDRSFVVGNDEELRVVGESVQGLTEATDIGVVECGIDLVEHTERAGLDHINREEQSDCGHGALTTGEQCDALQACARGSGNDLDSGLQRVFGIDQFEVGIATA